MTWLAAIAFGVLLSPPATPDACREDITATYARESILWLARQTKDFEARARTGSEWQDLIAYGVGYNELQRDRAIERCVEDHWRTTFLRCFGDSSQRWACARRELPQPACLGLEHALFGMIDHDPGGRCGEPPHRYF